MARALAVNVSGYPDLWRPHVVFLLFNRAARCCRMVEKAVAPKVVPNWHLGKWNQRLSLHHPRVLNFEPHPKHILLKKHSTAGSHCCNPACSP